MVRLEMDEERMSHSFFAGLPAPIMALVLAAYFAGGMVAGVLYFRAVWWNARLFAGRRPARLTIALLVSRFILLGGILALTSIAGAMPLIATALGVLVARSIVVRRVRGAAS